MPKTNGWELADYDFDAQYVSDRNTACGGWLIPAIKMLKALKRRLFPELPSFFFEMLVTKLLGEITIPTYRNAGVSLTYPILIERFFADAGGWLQFPLSFQGSLTSPVRVDSAIAQGTKKMFETIKNYVEYIERASSGTEKQKLWRELFEEPFPAI